MGTSLYFKAGPVIYYMDAYSNASAPLTAKLSESPMQDGTSRSDNYRVNNRTVTLVGKITDVKLASSSDIKRSGDWVDGVYDIINSRTPVSLKHRVDKEPTTSSKSSKSSSVKKFADKEDTPETVKQKKEKAQNKGNSLLRFGFTGVRAQPTEEEAQ